MQHDALPLSKSTHIRVACDGGDREVTIASLRRRLGIDALVRLHPADFRALPAEWRHFVHFNLEHTTNAAGERYAVVPIVTAGCRRDDGTEVLPVIDLAPRRIGTCLEVRQGVPLAEIGPDLFAQSLPHIRSPGQLAQALIERYRDLFPDLSDAEIVARGCAVTRIAFDP
ncbi:hypothetical protein [uncultured Methylobacterium sp.]|uniref:hypothetical protein n=1 Tax=uncultured Methylobacterium sp. TaxID=157278 RepID=UPI002604DB5D|nr:hypothetical protein [uncultured Methylobacterium sp.]